MNRFTVAIVLAAVPAPAEDDREAGLSFTPPYAELDATYLVPRDSPVQTVADADQAAFTIATPATSAYTLVLKRDIRRARLVFLTNDQAD